MNSSRGLYGNNSLNHSMISSIGGNRTPKQVVHNYLQNNASQKRQFSPVPIPKVIENSTDLAYDIFMSI